MTHTLETLLPLLDKDGNPINQEASDKLQVWAAELDGWRLVKGDKSFKTPDLWVKDNVWYQLEDAPHYPTSLDAIYAAEKRAGLHDDEEYDLQEKWFRFADTLFHRLTSRFLNYRDVAFLTPAQRTVILILTLQQKQTL